jgi:hypothetical protein
MVTPSGGNPGDAHIGKPVDKSDERHVAEKGATDALQKDFHMSAGDATKAVQGFERAEAHAGKIDEKTITQDLTRITERLAKMFEPGPNGEPSLMQRCAADGHADTINQCFSQTTELARQVAASFESGGIKPGQDGQHAVTQLLKRLNTDRTT